VDALTTTFGSGRIVRFTAGRKDQHRKVCTACGLRDRRVRLAAHTAIRFYDVYDRLGYDRPSKAVNWLIRNAKVVIDELPDRAEATAAAEAAVEAIEQGEQMTSTSYRFGNPGGAITPPCGRPSPSSTPTTTTGSRRPSSASSCAPWAGPEISVASIPFLHWR
jgi:hypothetical protein